MFENSKIPISFLCNSKSDIIFENSLENSILFCLYSLIVHEKEFTLSFKLKKDKAR